MSGKLDQESNELLETLDHLVALGLATKKDGRYFFASHLVPKGLKQFDGPAGLLLLMVANLVQGVSETSSLSLSTKELFEGSLELFDHGFLRFTHDEDKDVFIPEITLDGVHWKEVGSLNDIIGFREN